MSSLPSQHPKARRTPDRPVWGKEIGMRKSRPVAVRPRRSPEPRFKASTGLASDCTADARKPAGCASWTGQQLTPRARRSIVARGRTSDRPADDGRQDVQEAKKDRPGHGRVGRGDLEFEEVETVESNGPTFTVTDVSSQRAPGCGARAASAKGRLRAAPTLTRTSIGDCFVTLAQ